MSKTRKEKANFEVEAVIQGIDNVRAEIDKYVAPLRDIYNTVCPELPSPIPKEKWYLCNGLRGLLERPKPIDITRIIGILIVGFAVIIDLLDILWLFAGWIPFAAIINIAGSVVATIILIHWCGPIGLLFGWEILLDVGALLLTFLGDIFLILALLPSSLIILAAWFILFRPTKRFQPISA